MAPSAPIAQDTKLDYLVAGSAIAPNQPPSGLPHVLQFDVHPASTPNIAPAGASLTLSFDVPKR